MRRNAGRSAVRGTSTPRFAYVTAAGVLLPLAAALIAWRIWPGARLSVAAACLAAALVSPLRAIAEFVLFVRPMRRLERATDAYLREALAKGDAEAALADRSVEHTLNMILRDQLQRLKRHDRQEAEWQQTELYALQSQINPHFLYNTLDSIRGFALIHGVDEIASMAEALSNFFHNVIARQGQLISLREELVNVANYMEIQQFRFNNRFLYMCDVPEALQNAYMTPNLTLQPIVENGIMHGLEKKLGRGDIRISGYATDERLVLQVMDNGVGMDDAAMEQLNRRLSGSADHPPPSDGRRHSGIALANINRRIKLKFGDQYGLYVMSTLGVGTTVELTLPLCKAEDPHKSLYE